MVKLKRHRVTIKRPSTAKGTLGQRTGADTILLADVPCSIMTLAGNELEHARQTVANATHRVEMWIDPANPLTTLDYLVLSDGRRLNIGHVDDLDQKGLEYVLLCGEAKAN